jgi:hypothetical protein
MNSLIREATLKKTEKGNDPNDNREEENYLPSFENKQGANWMQDFVVSDADLAKIADPKWVYPNLIIHSHILVIPAPPNGGKTTLMLWIAGEIAEEYDVYYVNADVSGADAKKMAEKARGRYTIMFPDMKIGLSMDDVVTRLEEMNQKDADYGNMVFIFDTLKKMTDVISKGKAKQLFKTLRGLTGKGMTIILLAHTNKYKDADDKPIFEGVGDVRSDCDDMIYLESQKHQDRSMTISTVPDKERGDFEPLTFDVSRRREVTPCEFIDIKKDKKLRRQRAKDNELIEAISDFLSDGNANQGDIIKFCKPLGFNNKRIRDVLKLYSQEPSKIWHAQKGEKNSWNYELLRSH